MGELCDQRPRRGQSDADVDARRAEAGRPVHGHARRRRAAIARLRRLVFRLVRQPRRADGGAHCAARARGQRLPRRAQLVTARRARRVPRRRRMPLQSGASCGPVWTSRTRWWSTPTSPSSRAPKPRCPPAFRTFGRPTCSSSRRSPAAMPETKSTFTAPGRPPRRPGPAAGTGTPGWARRSSGAAPGRCPIRRWQIARRSHDRSVSVESARLADRRDVALALAWPEPPTSG